MMIGIPGETIKDFKETIKICRICQPKEVLEYIFYPYPGTYLYELCKKNEPFTGVNRYRDGKKTGYI